MYGWEGSATNLLLKSREWDEHYFFFFCFGLDAL